MKIAVGRRGVVVAAVAVFGTTMPAVAMAAPESAETVITASPSASVASTGARVTVRGSVDGGTREVRLQQLVGRSWRTVDTATANGAFTLSLPTDEPDVTSYRVYAPATTGSAAGTSRSFKVGIGDGDVRAVSYLTTPAVRWDPCAPVGYRVNLAGAPEGALDDVNRAVAKVSAATGVTFRYLGTTSVVPGASSTDSLSPYPADTRLVVAYSTPGKSKFLGKGTDVLGVGGVFYDLTPVKVGRTSWYRALQGYVVLDSRRELPGGFGTGSEQGALGTWGQVLMHELGHAVGLDHPAVADKSQIMFHETTYKQARWGAGDLVGLRRLGAASGCLSKGKAPGLSTTDRAVSPTWGMPTRPTPPSTPERAGRVQAHGH